MYSDNILFQAFKLIRTVFRALLLIVLTIMIAFFNDFGWLVGLGSNGYISRKSDYDNYQHQWYYGHRDHQEPVAVTVDFSSFSDSTLNIGSTAWFAATDYVPAHQTVDSIDAKLLCNASTSFSDTTPDINSHLDNNFYTRSQNTIHRKVARMSLAVMTASIATLRLRAVIARLKEGKSAGVNEDDSHYCGNWASTLEKEYRLSDPAAARVILVHAPKVDLSYGVACVSGASGVCAPKPSFYADLFSVSLSPEQEEAEAKMLQMGTEDFWLTAAHENGVYNDSAIRASVQAFHRILNERHPHFDEGGVQDTRSATLMQIVGLQNFE